MGMLLAQESKRINREREAIRTMKSDALPKSSSADNVTPESGATTSRTRPRQTIEDRINEAIEQRAQLNAHMRALAAKQRREKRKRSEEVESIIGAVCRVDPATHEAVRAAIARNVLDPKRRGLLKQEGWL
jgi:Spy/CpxP family protein refolding chaperone